MRKIIKFIVGKPKTVLFFVFLITLFFSFYSIKLQIDASSQTLLLENDKDLEIWRDVSKRYKVPDLLIVAFTPKDELFSDKNINTIISLSKEFEKFPFVKSVLNITNVPLFQSKKQKITEFVKNTPTLLDKTIPIENIKNEFKTSSIYSSNIISKDLKTTAIVISLEPNTTYRNFIDKKDVLLDKEKNKTITKDEKIELAKIDKKFKVYREENRIKEHDELM